MSKFLEFYETLEDMERSVPKPKQIKVINYEEYHRQKEESNKKELIKPNEIHNILKSNSLLDTIVVLQ